MAYIGFESKENKILSEGKCNSHIISTFEGICCLCAKYRIIKFSF